MDNNEMGKFIVGLRKEKNLTQKDLAEKLHITDKAVSKWERGLSCPDIALLPELAMILGVTVDELLNARKNPTELVYQEAKIETVIDYAEKSLDGRVKKVRKICAAVYSVFLFVGMAVCIICDLAVSGILTWSLFPVSSMIFAWLVLFPMLQFGEKGVEGTLLVLSVLTLPYLYVLTRLTKGAAPLMPVISRRVTVIALLLIWAVYGLFRTFRQRKLLAAALSFLVAVPVCFAINYSLAGILGISVLDGWDILAILFLITGSAVFFMWDKKMCNNKNIVSQ